MKNSLKFLTAAGVLLVGSLTTYNAALRAEYQRGAFKDPLSNYKALPLRNFNILDVPAAGAMRVRVESGPFAVYINKDAAQYVQVKQQNSQLTLALNYPEKEEYLGQGDAVIVRCPRLNLLTASTIYTRAGSTQTTKQQNDVNGTLLLIKGFTQDSLRVMQNHTSHVVLAGNHLGQLRAVVGNTAGSTAELDLSADNLLGATDVRVRERSKLVANDVALPGLRWQFSDSAQVQLSGAALRALAK
ncbi:hypothetical protein [Hymenobacter sp. YC55]|uniref:hypothetical protein n=1 Tax=Hymenobacter sp. YC55 TaxID=3034019 RepID=UPI0023F71E0C|nr:hypothetical protein [Hymenobacter sp. YC55]MDF7813426.1 hypothetical protein [Hymenobacter sp. YC55]